jgi:hypothetical protein
MSNLGHMGGVFRQGEGEPCRKEAPPHVTVRLECMAFGELCKGFIDFISVMLPAEEWFQHNFPEFCRPIADSLTCLTWISHQFERPKGRAGFNPAERGPKFPPHRAEQLKGVVSTHRYAPFGAGGAE